MIEKSISLETSNAGPGPTETELHTGKAPAVDPPTQWLDGYEVIEEIARGGMGVVYKARHLKLHRLVALKMIRGGELADDEQVQRFLLEAQSAAKLDHPGIVPIYEVGVAASRHYFTMAFVNGQSLNQRVKHEGPLPPRAAVLLMKDVAEAVQYAHEQGIVHRDLKPHNVLVDEHGQPRVTDFGLAKQLQSGSDLTVAGQVMGTPSYMPPEQAEGDVANIGASADVYSMGATLYYTLTGRPPFESASVVETLRQVIEIDPAPPRSLNPAIPRDLETICLKCLRKKRSQRYASASDFAADLERWLDHRPIVARRVGLFERTWLWCRRRPGLVALTFVFAALVIAGSLFATERHYATRAEGLVDAFVNADTQQTPALAAELLALQRWTEPLLRESFDSAPDDSNIKLHAGLALVASDHSYSVYVRERLQTARPEEIRTIRYFLQPLHAELTSDHWQALAQPAQRQDVLRSAAVLAAWSPDDERWKRWHAEVARELVNVPALESKAWIENLRPVGHFLIADLETLLQGRDADEASQRRIAAAALAEYFASQPDRLCELALIGENESEFMPFIERLRRHRAAAELHFRKILMKPIPEDVAARPQAWKRQANAALGLLELGSASDLWPLLKFSSDPTLRSFLVRRFHQLACSLQPLANRLASEKDVTIRRALILSLGEYRRLDIPSVVRQDLLQLMGKYYHDPDPGVHSAVEWTLRNWQETELLNKLHQAVRDRNESSERGWFVNSAGQTFVVIKAPTPATSLIFGSIVVTPPTQTVVLERSFALSTHEITWEEFLKFNPDYMVYAKHPAPAGAAVQTKVWTFAMAYCNWLSQQEGIPQDQWCYPATQFPDPTQVTPDMLRRRGYRLPTEAEWEYACRAGTTTTYSFGEAPELLGDYAWFLGNTPRNPSPVGLKKPNDFGAFDMHGNMYEWCHRGHLEGETAARGVTLSVLRGGSFYLEPRTCTSVTRHGFDVRDDHYLQSIGFRIARSWP